MNNECTDRDLLALEPAIFAGGGFESQQLAAGTDGGISGTGFASLDADFQASGVEAGMVLCVYATVPAEARSYEVVSVDSATALTVSVLRADAQADPIAPPPGADLKYYVSTFAPQIAQVQRALMEKLRGLGQIAGANGQDFADSARLRRAVVLGTLAVIFAARTSNAGRADANWTKAEFYRREHAAAVTSARLVRDADGDGYAERTCTLGHISLRRE